MGYVREVRVLTSTSKGYMRVQSVSDDTCLPMGKRGLEHVDNGRCR
jgi:hypothetical protein